MELKTKVADVDPKGLRTVGTDGAGLAEGIIATFDCILTTNRIDRDGDILEPGGATIDPKMALLFQHDASSPIGRFVEVVQRDAERIVARYEIADTALGRDSVKLLKLGILRISHGFRPEEFEPMKNAGGGYHVRKYEVLETSLVSVPANRDAEILSLSTKSLESPAVREWIEALQKGNVKMTTATEEKTETKAPAWTPDEIKNAVKDGMTEALTAFATKSNGDGKGKDGKPTPGDLLIAAGNGSPDVRVKNVSERFSRETKSLKHFRTGEIVRDEHGREPQSVSELQNAKAGAFLKTLAQKAGLPVALTDDDRALMELTYAEKWCGQFGNESFDEIDGVRVKTLLADSVSGGSAAVPVWFDRDLISFPLLSGELYPYVNVVNVPQGKAVAGASVGNPSVFWGSAEGTEISLFDTTALIAALSSSIFNVAVAIEVGRDFLADSPADVGRVLVETVGAKLASEMDRVIAVGNGTSEPEGIFTASGTTSVPSAGGVGAVNTLADWQNLLFGLPKQYRNAANRCAFISNDTTFARSRAIRVDPQASTVNQLPVLSPVNDINNYSTLGWMHKIQNDIGNSSIGFVALAKYRLYRRAGFEIRWEQGGAQLARRNTALLICRGRFGGLVTDGDSAAIMPDAKS